jgi:hypothetical protein
MRACRIEALAVAALLAGAAPAAAQVGAPIPLVPPPSPAPTGGGGAPSGEALTPIPKGFEAQSLAPTDASWIGVLGDAQGAMPETMWRGTPRNFVAAALPLLRPSSSAVVQDLARRLLLSNAASPAGPDVADRPSLAAERLDRLMALGDVEGAVAMMDQLPADATGDGMDETRVELRFAAGDRDGACKAINDGIARYQSAWWQRALIACQALGGNGAEASLGLSVLREQKAPPDAPFDVLIDMLGGQPHKIGKIGEPTPMRLTLLAAAKQPLPPAVLAAAGPAALLAYARSDDLPAEARLAAAERAALLGAMKPEALGDIYKQVQVKPEEQMAALKDGKLPEDAKGRAILYQAARSAAPSDTRAAAITAFLAGARKQGMFPLAARLMLPALGELGPADPSSPVAADAARALLVTGDAGGARGWIDAAGSKSLVLLHRIATEPAEQSEDAAALLRDTIAELANRDGGAAQAQAEVLLALLAAFDEPLGALDWAPLMTPPHDAKLPGAALWIDQQQAVNGKRLGEAVLATILLLNAAEPLSQEPMLLGRAITGLRTVGLEADARALAVEAAIDAGI